MLFNKLQNLSLNLKYILLKNHYFNFFEFGDPFILYFILLITNFPYFKLLIFYVFFFRQKL